MVTKFRKEAEPIAQAIIDKVAFHLRHKMSCWPKEDDLSEMKREIKSIIVQHMESKE